MEVFNFLAGKRMVGRANFITERKAAHPFFHPLALIGGDEGAFKKKRMREFVKFRRQTFVAWRQR